MSRWLVSFSERPKVRLFTTETCAGFEQTPVDNRAQVAVQRADFGAKNSSSFNTSHLGD